VLDSQVARTESGIHVGSTRAELEKAGPLLDELGRTHDPRMAMLASPRGVRVLFDPDPKKDRIAAIVVTTEPPKVAAPPNESACPRPRATNFAFGAFGACLLGTGSGEEVEVGRHEITIRSAETGKSIGPPLRISNDIEFARPLRIEGRDELVIVTHDEEPQIRTWSLVAYRLEGGKLTKTADKKLYSLSATNARWIGVELAEIDLYLELAAGRDTIEVGGLLTTRADLPDAQAPWRDVVVISPVSVPRRHEKPAKAVTPLPDGSGSGNDVDAGALGDPSKP
jgi:hypothetical protein